MATQPQVRSKGQKGLVRHQERQPSTARATPATLADGGAAKRIPCTALCFEPRKKVR